MFRGRKKVHFLYLIIDIFFMVSCFYLSYMLRCKFIIAGQLQKDYLFIFALWGIILALFLNNYHLYITDRSLTIPLETLQVFKAVTLSSFLIALTAFVLQTDFFSRFIFAASTLSLIISLSFWRAVKRILIRHRIVKGFYNINVLIVGAGRSGKELVEEIRENPYLGIKVMGFLDDSKTGAINGHRILGQIKDIEKIVQRYFVDEIYITIPSQHSVVSEVILKARNLKKTIRVLTDQFGLPIYQSKINYIGLYPLISYYERGIHGTDLFIKRAFDLIIALVAIIILLPVFLIIALLIKIDSPGSVLYVSLRAGRKGKPFNFYKFRSMYNNAHRQKESLRSRSEVKGPIFKIRDDPRITRIGKVLRKYSLDELPQLINVLRGEMSLIGPRPLPVEESSQCELWQLRRLEVKPGIACIAQTRGRSDLSFHKWMKWDLWYIDNWSLDLDLRIIIWVIPAVLRRKGAY